MWLLIQKVMGIWHIDATGNVMQPMYGQKSTLLYSIVVYDPQNKKNIPLFEFVTTDQTVKQISMFLFFVKEYCLKYKKLGGQSVRHAYAEIITTDFSYILINSILKIFNHCDMEEYLKATFQCLVEKIVPHLFVHVMIYLCSTHFLKSFIKKVNKSVTKEIDESINPKKQESKIEKEKKQKKKERKKLIVSKNKKLIIFCFTLLQNSTSLIEFCLVLENVFNLFNQRKQNEKFSNAQTFIDRSMEHRKLKFDINLATSQKDRERSKMFSQFKNSDTKKEKKSAKDSYMATSPWSPYFNKMIDEFQRIHISDSRLEADLKPNIFFRPDLFKLIKKQLYLTPVWSGIFIALHFEANKGSYYNIFFIFNIWEMKG